jgi:hypothetical protein
VAWHGVALAHHAGARDRRGGAGSGAPRIPPIRPRELPGRRRAPARHGGCAAPTSRPPGALRRVQPGHRNAVAHGEPAHPRAHEEPEARSRVAFRGARDRPDAGAPARSGAPRPRAHAAARLGGLPRGTRAGRPALRGDRSRRRRLLRLARGGAGADGPARHAPPRGADCPRAARELGRAPAPRRAARPRD